MEQKLKECQDKSDVSSGKRKIGTAKIELKIPIQIWSLATDEKGNIYVGSRSVSWYGTVYKCLAGESEFKPMSGVKEEVWTIILDEDENIYVGTRAGIAAGGVYKCLANEDTFKRMDGIDKCVSSLKIDGNIIYAKVWAGVDLNAITYNNVYKCLVGGSTFKPVI